MQDIGTLTGNSNATATAVSDNALLASLNLRTCP